MSKGLASVDERRFLEDVARPDEEFDLHVI